MLSCRENTLELCFDIFKLSIVKTSVNMHNKIEGDKDV